MECSLIQMPLGVKEEEQQRVRFVLALNFLAVSKEIHFTRMVDLVPTSLI